jgi:hypothetical protein
MDGLPFHYPQLVDIKQWAIELGDPELPHQVGAKHDALLDARWTQVVEGTAPPLYIYADRSDRTGGVWSAP